MTTPVKEKPLYWGHRERLRQRFMTDEGASMPDYEILELLLTMAIPRRDVKDLAKQLVNRFGDIGEVLHARAHELMDAGVSPNAIVLLRLVATCVMRSAYDGFHDSDEPIFNNWMQFEEYCRAKMAYKEIEEFRVFFLDAKRKLIGEKLITTGTINKSNIHPREIIRSALEYKAVYVILVHNHPSGNADPSKADINMTKAFEELAKVMDIKVFDHLIIGREGIFSFRSAGLLQTEEDDEKGE